jgi:hypothetical protein
MVSQKKAIGILGMAFAVAGGAAWFFGQYIPAVMLWGVAGIIMLKLNKRQQQKSKRR